MIKKMLVVLIAANILCHAATVETTIDTDGPVEELTPVVLKAVLGYSY